MNNELNFNDENVVLLDEVKSIVKSDTQSIKVLLLEKENKRYVSIQKWWKRKPEDEWLEGKGFHLNGEDAKDVLDALSTVIEKL